MDSSRLRLQQHIDCNLEVDPRAVLDAWASDGWHEEPGTDGDEAPLRYMSLVLLDAIEDRAVRLSVDKDEGVVVYGDEPPDLPKAPAHFIARGLEILREITGLRGPSGTGHLSLGVRNDSLEVIIQKDAGRHIINIPGVGGLVH